jgi:hypothetical protein
VPPRLGQPQRDLPAEKRKEEECIQRETRMKLEKNQNREKKKRAERDKGEKSEKEKKREENEKGEKINGEECLNLKRKSKREG